MINLKLSLLFCGILFIVVLPAKGQDAFYYYKQDSIQLWEDKTTLVLIFRPATSYLNDSTTFSGDTTIMEMRVSNGMEDTLFAKLSYSNPQNNLLSTLNRYPLDTSDLQTFGYGHITKDSAGIWLTNEVITELKGTSTLNGLLSFLELNFLNIKVEFLHQSEYGLITLKVENRNNVFKVANTLHKSGLVKYAEPNFYQEMKLNSHDPLYDEQYYLNNWGQTIDGTAATPGMDIDAPEAWSVTKGWGANPKIRVAVLDQGVEHDPPHEDMTNRVIEGYTPSCLINCDGRPRGNQSHGQACAGIIAANHNNHFDIRGVAPASTIIPIRMLNKNRSNIAKSINKSWDEFNADILTNSWSLGGHPSNAIEQAYRNAFNNGRNGRGCVIVHSAGNEGPSNNSVTWPSGLDMMITVSALDKHGNVTSYSSRGPEVDVAAFGGEPSDIRTLDCCDRGVTDDHMDDFDGTSAACPQVAGIAALLLARDQSLTAHEVRCRIRHSAIDMGAFGEDNNYGYGRANAYFTIAYDNMNINGKTFGGLQRLSASNTVASENTTIENGADVELIAGNRVHLRPGFQANAGSQFRARISNQGPCDTGPFKRGTDVHALPQLSPAPDEPVETAKHSPFSLNAYPNPVNNRLTIRYSLPRSSTLTLTVYNLQGKVVDRLLADKYHESGAYQQKLNASQLPPGVYYFSLQSADFKKTRKFVVIR